MVGSRSGCARTAGRSRQRVARKVAVFGSFRAIATTSLVLGGLVIGLSLPGAALADSATITITTTSGQSDPAAGLPRVFDLVGNSAAPEDAFVKYRAPGGAPCAPSAASDTGRTLEAESFGYVWWVSSVNGDFSFPTVLTWPSPGTTMFCIWIAEEAETIATPITQMVTFRAPGGTIRMSVNPPSPLPGQAATITIAGASEAPEEVFATVKPYGGGTACAPTFESDSGGGVIDNAEVNGSYSVQGTYTQESAGLYQLCAWLASSRSSTPAVAGPQAFTFFVGIPAPPPPPPPPPPSHRHVCVVPKFNSHMSLATVERRIVRSHCRVGQVGYARSRSVRRGDVVRLTPRPHTHLGRGAFVTILVSAGRR